MAKRYGLDSIIGKKSSLRFPRSVTHTKTDTISTILAANNVLSEPPFSTAITMKKGDSLDICDQLNELSYEYDINFPIKADILISNSGTKIEFKTPTIFSMINIIYDLDDLLIENFRVKKTDLSLSISNISLAKINSEEDIFLSEIKSNMRMIYGNIRSYNCRRRRDKRLTALKDKIKKQKDIKKISKSRLYNHKRNLHYFVKTKRSNKNEKLPMLFDAIDVFYDLYDDWDDLHDEYFQDHYLVHYDNNINLVIMNEEFYLNKMLNNNKKILPQILYFKEILNQHFSKQINSDIETTKNNIYLSYMLLKNSLEEEEEQEEKEENGA